VSEIQHGDRVVCLEASIDARARKGSEGIVAGFARLSSHHAREAMVKFGDGSSAWFWTRDLSPA
jgi:hypothetical protein